MVDGKKYQLLETHTGIEVGLLLVSPGAPGARASPGRPGLLRDSRAFPELQDAWNTWPIILPDILPGLPRHSYQKHYF